MRRLIEKSQQKVEGMNYEIRKNLLKYDDVMNEQRKIIFEQRKDIITAKDVSPEIDYLREEINRTTVASHIPEKTYVEQWDLDGLDQEITRVYSLDLRLRKFAEQEGVSEGEILKHINEKTSEHFKKKEELYGDEIMRSVEKRIFLMTLDNGWKDHLYTLDKLKKGINLRAYGQKDPLIEYKKEAFQLFEYFLNDMNLEVVRRLAHIQLRIEEDTTTEDVGLKKLSEERIKYEKKMHEGRKELTSALGGKLGARNKANTPVKQIPVNKRSRAIEGEFDANNPSTWGRVGRNDTCPCGSGKKFKQCHGKIG